MKDEPFFYNTHPFTGNSEQCEYIVNDYVGQCSCVKSNPIHL